MKLLVSLILCLLGQVQLMEAQPIPEDQVPRLPKLSPHSIDKTLVVNRVISNLKKNFSNITSFAFSEQQIQNNNVSWALCWKEIENRYYYEVMSGNMDDITAFDGKRLSILRGSGGLIFLKNGDRPELKPKNLPSPLDLYSFLKTDDSFMSLNNLRSDSPLWDNLSTRITYVGTQKFMDADCIVLRFSNSFSHIKSELAVYDVYFDSQNLMPVGWRSFDAQKFMIEQLEALDLKTIADKTSSASFTYPSHCRVTEYQWPGTMTITRSTGLTDQSSIVKYYKGIFDFHHDNVEVNSLSPEDIQIDPSLAKGIADGDSHAVTQLPH